MKHPESCWCCSCWLKAGHSAVVVLWSCCGVTSPAPICPAHMCVISQARPGTPHYVITLMSRTNGPTLTHSHWSYDTYTSAKYPDMTMKWDWLSTSKEAKKLFYWLWLCTLDFKSFGFIIQPNTLHMKNHYLFLRNIIKKKITFFIICSFNTFFHKFCWQHKYFHSDFTLLEHSQQC